MSTVTFAPVTASTVGPPDTIVAIWASWSGSALSFDLYAETSLGNELAAHWTAADGITYGTGYDGTLDVSATITIAIWRHGGWDDQSGTFTVRAHTVDTGVGDEYDSATYTLSSVVPSDPVLTHTADGLDRMLDQFDGSVNLRALASSYLDQIQEFENAAYPLINARSLEVARGHRLDGLGQIAGLARSGRDDADYRSALTAEFAVLRSSGTAEELIAIAQLLVQMGTSDYDVREYYPKGFYIRPVDHVLTVDPVLVGTMLDRAVSAATTMSFVYSNFADATTFTLSSQGATVETSTSLGLADVSQTTGGHLSGVE